jgi:hypothetical protein
MRTVFDSALRLTRTWHGDAMLRPSYRKVQRGKPGWECTSLYSGGSATVIYPWREASKKKEPGLA